MRRLARSKAQQLRAQPLVVDPTTTVDLADYDPPIEPRTAGSMLWIQLCGDVPYWWDSADVPAASMLAVATDAVADAMADPETSAAGRATILKEWRALAGELGLSPTSRGRLRLTEAQGVVAARKVDAMEDERGRRRTKAIDLDELTDD